MKRDNSQIKFNHKFYEVETNARKAQFRIAQLEKMEIELMSKIRSTTNYHQQVIDQLHEVVYTQSLGPTKRINNEIK